MPDPQRHEAFPYAGRPEFVPACVSVVQDGLAHDERLILLAAGEKLADVRDELGADADEVTFVSTDEHGRNPSRITNLLYSFQAAGDGRHSLGVNESVVFSRSPAAMLEAQLSDSVLNDPALSDLPLSVVCLYDTSELDAAVQEAMQNYHAVIRGSDNPNYLPDFASSIYATAPDPPPEDAHRLQVSGSELSEMRAFVRGYAAGLRIHAGRTDDLVLAANEVVTNSLLHGRGAANLAIWSEDGSVICEVRDQGYIESPLTGRFAPPPGATSGRGLWLANHLCDLVSLRSSAAGTVVRMYIDG